MDPAVGDAIVIETEPGTADEMAMSIRCGPHPLAVWDLEFLKVLTFERREK